jgi:phosphoribosylglycinamide formyltransferase-1
MSGGRKGIVILISGRGSNMQAIVEQVQKGHLPVEVRAVISNNPGAAGLKWARDAGIPTEAISHRDFPDRASFDRALMEVIDAYQPDLVVLAGFMRILGHELVDHYAGRLINIHPALLPDFPGLDTHARALAAGHEHHGATVHFVTNEVDAGPIIIQAAVEVKPGDDADMLAARVLEQEHRIYPLAVQWFAEDRLSIRDGVVLLDGARRPEQGLVEPTRR